MTIGIAKSEWLIRFKTSSFINLINCKLTDFLNTKRTIRALKITGFPSFLCYTDTGVLLTVPILSAKTSGNLLIKSPFGTLHY